MRPKSIATVVVDFPGVWARSSTPTDSLVTRASVRSGTISETDPTRVVLPTPNPPAMTIFVDAAVRLTPWEALESTESTEGPFEEVVTFVGGGGLGQGRLDVHVSLLDEVSEQHPHDTDRTLDQGRHLGDRPGVQDADDLSLDVLAPGATRGAGVQPQPRLQREVDRRAGAPRRQCIRSNDARSRRAGVHLLDLGLVCHVSPTYIPCTRAWACTIWPTRSTRRAIS